MKRATLPLLLFAFPAWGADLHLQSVAEAPATPRAVVIAGFAWATPNRDSAPNAGFRVTLLKTRDTELSAAAVYRGVGYEGKRDVTISLSVARAVGQAELYATVTYGEELDEPQHHADLRFAALRRIGRELRVGLDVRGSFDLDNGRVEDHTVEDLPSSVMSGAVLVQSLGPHAALLVHVAAHTFTAPAYQTTTAAVAVAGVAGQF
jgi:hypothetical protein